MATLEAYERFIANEPEGEIEYRTVEAYSSAFGVVRYVFDIVAHNFLLEAGAPRNASETVPFSPTTGRVIEPAEREDGEQQLSINLGGANGVLNDLISMVSGAAYFEPIEIIYRKYFSGDLSQPAITPLYLHATDINFEGVKSVSIIAEDSNLSAKRPGRYYLLSEFKGLAP